MSDFVRPRPAGGDEDNSHMLLVVIWVEASLGAMVMIARLVTKSYIAQNLGWDDFLMVITWLCAITTNCVCTIGLRYGIGRHMYFLSPDDASKAIKMDWLSHAPALTANTLGKVAFAVFLLRIIPRSKTWMRRFLHGYNALLIAINIPMIIITYAQCSPVAGLWDTTIKAKCWPPHIQASYGLFQGSYGAFADFILALFPIVILWDLKIDKKVKFGLALLMGLGIFTSGCSVGKTYYVPRMKARADFTWQTQYMMIWFTTETYSIIIAATVPTLRPLLKWITDKDFRSSRYKNDYLPHGQPAYALSDLQNQMGKRSHRTVKISSPKDETDSDHLVLPPTKIQKTTDINIDYDQVSIGNGRTMGWSPASDGRVIVHPEDKV